MNAAKSAVGGQRQCRPLPPLEQLGERVLQKRQRSRLVPHVGDEFGDETRFEVDAEALRGTDDRSLQLLRIKRSNRLQAPGHEPTHPGMPQWPVVEVGAQRGDDP